MADEPNFRAVKRRKQKRHVERESTASEEEELEQSSVVRASKQQRVHSKGIHVHNVKTSRVVDTDQLDDTLDTGSGPAPNAFQDRFVGGTGQVSLIDKNLTAYVDSEIAKRRYQDTQSQPQPAIYSNGEQKMPLSSITIQKQSSIRHDFAEVDLESVAKDATKPAEGKSKKRRKPRIGRDGKPFRPRPRKRQNSADAVRDSLVEQVLHETALDVYGSSSSDSSSDSNDERDADRRAAEKFQLQFLEAQTEKVNNQQPQRAKGAALTGSSGGGPKLGGGRSARARMNAGAQGESDKAAK